MKQKEASLDLTKLLASPLFRYLLVGGSAFIAEYGSFFSLYELLKVQLYIANSLSFCVGLLFSFIFNRIWAFKRDNFRFKKHHQFLLYSSLALLNLLLTNVLIGLFRHLGLDPKVGKIVVMLVIIGWNFGLFHMVIFSEHKPPAGD